tara:strand:+ start:6665 stop:6913 length:249 start_codon:yes stop_codon:yes gene_type:complete
MIVENYRCLYTVNKYMNIENQELTQRVLQLTWRNPAFMAIAIAAVWLIPQIMIRKIMQNNYEKGKLEKQKQKINKLYPKSSK